MYSVSYMLKYFYIYYIDYFDYTNLFIMKTWEFIYYSMYHCFICIWPNICTNTFISVFIRNIYIIVLQDDNSKTIFDSSDQNELKNAKIYNSIKGLPELYTGVPSSRIYCKCNVQGFLLIDNVFCLIKMIDTNRIFILLQIIKNLSNS